MSSKNSSGTAASRNWSRRAQLRQVRRQPREKRHGKHPTQKAERVFERIILAGTNAGDLILDCFSGAGSTAVVAERLGRQWVLIEKERKFNQIARKRLEELRKSRSS
ncbi:MAG: site-specific DNA-methyltransferase [Candidatus Hydrogenedentes bacterium]|nr:site-specific DNA-methyltransferase [Candidatus Hydrogenedentota bacterium]